MSHSSQRQPSQSWGQSWNTALQPVHYELLRCYNQYLPLKSSWLFSNAKTLGGIWNSQVPYHWCRTCRLSREAAANKIITEHHRTDSRREKNRLEKKKFLSKFISVLAQSTFMILLSKNQYSHIDDIRPSYGKNLLMTNSYHGTRLPTKRPFWSIFRYGQKY